MNKLDYLKLTQAVYRVTDGFPAGEPLKFKIREMANQILSDLVLFNPTGQEKILKDIEVLDNYFEVARIQNWVNPLNFFVLEQEYSKIKESIAKSEKAPKAVPKQPVTLNPVQPASEPRSSGRHQKILEILKEKGQAQVWEIKRIFPETSKRTLRRDFDYLLKQGIIERIGEKNGTSYKIKEVGPRLEVKSLAGQV
jgi:predicted HTH transcriptional regulator